MRGELMWIGWVSGNTLLQGSSVMMSVFIFNGTSGRGKLVRKLYRMGMDVNSPTHTQEDWVDSNLCTLELFAANTCGTVRCVQQVVAVRLLAGH
eukprot:1158631-Pelagomonas_calceolata.AAC.4